MTRRLRWTGPAILVASALALGACGISASSQPKIVGDAYAPPALSNIAEPAAQPDASTPEQLVLDYLDAAAGGGEPAAAQVSRFLTASGNKRWQRPDANSKGIKIIRVLGAPHRRAQTPDGVTPVVVVYEEIGTLGETGQISMDPPPLTPVSRTFQVVRAADGSGHLRIDDGALPGLVLSDQALANNNYYRLQPIYFWDAANRVLVPDLRYVPLTISPDQRAYNIVTWLLRSPSQLLGTEAVNLLPINSSLADFKSRDTTMIVKLSAQAGGKGPDDVRRLVYQLEASLLPNSGRDLEIWVGNSLVSNVADVSNYAQYDLGQRLQPPMQKYDIVDGVVKPIVSDVNGSSPDLPLLGAKENSQVRYAAINRDNDLAALVRGTPSNPSLVIIPATGKLVVARHLPHSADVGRPAWIPGADALLIAWGGRLYQVDRAGNATQVPTPGLGPITAASVAPDGRRVALVAGGQVIIAVLAVAQTPTSISVHLGGQPQTVVVDAALVASGVAWESEEQVYIVGRVHSTPALWLASIDGAVATDSSSALHGVAPVDVVAYPSRGAFSKDGEAVVLQLPGADPYRFNSSGVVPDKTQNPFYVD